MKHKDSLTRPCHDVERNRPSSGTPHAALQSNAPRLIGTAVNSLTFAVGRADDVAGRRQHHLIELLGKHRRSKEPDRSQHFGSRIDQIMPHVGWQHENAARSHSEVAIVALQLTGPGNDVLRLFRLIGVSAEPTAGLDFKHNGRRLVCAMLAIGDKCSRPADRLDTFAVKMKTRQVICSNWIHQFILPHFTAN